MRTRSCCSLGSLRCARFWRGRRIGCATTAALSHGTAAAAAPAWGANAIPPGAVAGADAANMDQRFGA
eukprot:4939770-Pyramimonas_sp.AAC.1